MRLGRGTERRRLRFAAWIAVSGVLLVSLVVLDWQLHFNQHGAITVGSRRTESQLPGRAPPIRLRSQPNPTKDMLFAEDMAAFEGACSENVLLAPSCAWGTVDISSPQKRAGLSDSWPVLQPILEASRDRIASKLIPLFIDAKGDDPGQGIAMSFMIEELWGDVPVESRDLLYAYSYGDKSVNLDSSLADLGLLLLALRNEENRVSKQIEASLTVSRVEELRASGALSQCVIHLRCNDPWAQGDLGASLLLDSGSVTFVNVAPKGAARLAGIEEGDTLLYVDEIPAIDAVEYVRSRSPGTTLMVALERHAQLLSVSVTLDKSSQL